MTLHARLQDLEAAKRELLHLRARHPQGRVVLRLPLLGRLHHRVVHRHELVTVTSMPPVPILRDLLVESFEGKYILVDVVVDELRQLCAGKAARAWGGGGGKERRRMEGSGRVN